MCSAKGHVRFTPESGHVRRKNKCPLSANSGHSRNDLRKTERPPRGGQSEIRSGVLIRLRVQQQLFVSCATRTDPTRRDRLREERECGGERFRASGQRLGYGVRAQNVAIESIVVSTVRILRPSPNAPIRLARSVAARASYFLVWCNVTALVCFDSVTRNTAMAWLCVTPRPK
jgi:hypothetical protein